MVQLFIREEPPDLGGGKRDEPSLKPTDGGVSGTSPLVTHVKI